MTERLCLRACIRKGEHYAACESWTNPDHNCPGCVPWEAAHGSLLCPKCVGRMKYLLNNIGDLHGRLTAKADPLTASPLDQVRVRASTTDLPAAADADLLDALTVVTIAASWANTDVTEETNNRETAVYLGALLLERHKPVNGIRETWSVQDAVDTWGIERRADTFIYPEDDDDTGAPAPVTEWYDPLLTVRQAADRHRVTERAVQLWIKKGILPVAARARGPRGSVLSYVRASESDTAAHESTRRKEARWFASQHVD